MDEHQPAEDIAAMGAPASPDALKEIVARHHRRRTRTLGVLLAVALVAGPVAGWAVGQGGGGGGQQLATGSNANTPTAANAPPAGALSGGASASAIASPDLIKAKTTHLFTRTTSGGITIRAYRVDPPEPPPSTSSTTTKGAETICPKPMIVTPGASAGSGGGGVSSGGVETKPAPPGAPVNAPPPCAPGAPPICKTAPSVLAELSDDAAVGQSFDPIDDKQPTDALSHLVVGSFGGMEGTPATFVTVQTGPGVATVRLRVPSGGADQMAPSNGVAVLAIGTAQPPPSGTVVEALDGSGNVLASQPVDQPGPKMAFACGVTGGPLRAYQMPVPSAPPTTR